MRSALPTSARPFGRFPSPAASPVRWLNFEAGRRDPAAGLHGGRHPPRHDVSDALLYSSLTRPWPPPSLSQSLSLVDLGPSAHWHIHGRWRAMAARSCSLWWRGGGAAHRGVGLRHLPHLYQTSKPHVAVVARSRGPRISHVPLQVYTANPSLRVDQSPISERPFLEDPDHDAVAANPAVRTSSSMPRSEHDRCLGAGKPRAINHGSRTAALPHLSEVKGRSWTAEEVAFSRGVNRQVHLTQYDACSASIPTCRGKRWRSRLYRLNQRRKVIERDDTCWNRYRRPRFMRVPSWQSLCFC